MLTTLALAISCFLSFPLLVLCTLDPHTIPKYENDLLIPQAMPQSTSPYSGEDIDYYELAVRQFQQRILPKSMGLMTTVWGYGSLTRQDTCDNGGTFCTPSPTIEARQNRTVRVKWLNQLVDRYGDYLPHLLAVDQTIHWANPVGPVDHAGVDQSSYTGPVPLVPHLHGGHSTEDSDGYPTAWFLPAASNIGSFIPYGSMYNYMKNQSRNGADWAPGSAVFNYPNQQRACTLWYHDHSLGLVRVNVYAGPAGFYIIRGTEDTQVKGVLPGPAPQVGDLPGKEYYEIPLIVQDRIFNEDGSLFYPLTRAFFEGVNDSDLQIPYDPSPACGGPSDIHPIWQPEFYGDSIIVNGRAWPKLDVANVRYRFRLLNACNGRVLILTLDKSDLSFWVIGNDGGYLTQPVALKTLIVGPAERLDIEIDFTNYYGQQVKILNIGPDGGYGDGAFDPADPDTTGQIIRFDVTKKASTADPSTPPSQLVLPAVTPIDTTGATHRQVSVIDEDSTTVHVDYYGNGTVYLKCDSDLTFEMAVTYLGTFSGDPANGGTNTPLMWSSPATETPKKGVVEIWDFINLTEDAHPMHIHQVQFQVLQRIPIGDPDNARNPDVWETGFKDTLIALPDEITRVALRFDIAGNFVWHCHLLEHEDSELMRPIVVSA